MSSSNEPASQVPPAAKGSWMSFIKSISNFSGDLSSLTAPPWILSPTSLVEFSSYWAEHPSIFVAPANEKDPAKRALYVLRWFLSTLKQQYSSRNEQYGTEKKPLNPFLGELFLGKWEDDAGTTKLISEQVSHHPPVTGYCIFNEKHGVRLQGYNGQKASFGKTINVKQIGHAIFSIDGYKEDYLITLPSLHIEGLIYGSPFIELDGTSYIQSSSGYTAKVDYSGRGWLSGKKNTFTASLYPEGKPKEPLYIIDGNWNESLNIREAEKGKAKKGDPIEVVSLKTTKTTPLTVAPLDQQDEYESRRAWEKVAKGIQSGDMDTVSKEKGTIENQQREMRKKEKEEGREWERRYFSKADKHETFDALAKKVGETPDADKTNGVWVFDAEKEKNKPAFKE